MPTLVSRRRPRRRRLIPWLLAVALLGGVAYSIHTTLRERDLVAVATSVRNGNPAFNIEKDPRGCIELLQPLLDRDPDHFEARMLRARAWADLKAWDFCVEDLEHAANTAADEKDLLRAMRQKLDFLILADRFDDAVAVGQQMVEIEPDLARQLQLGTAYYKGSLFAQRELLKYFALSLKDEEQLRRERRIDAFITNIWSTPDADGLLDTLLPDADPLLIAEVSELLMQARERFVLASEAFSVYPHYGGFDLPVAKAYVEILYRAGRVYEAVLESDIALREADLNYATEASFLEVQAEAAASVGHHAVAADRWQRCIELFSGADKYVPPRYIAGVYENRIEAGQWDWILSHAIQDSHDHGDNLMIGYGRAAALFATGDKAMAWSVLADPYARVSRGSLNVLGPSMREKPERRRNLMMLAYRIMDALGDASAGTALDDLLRQFPGDEEARRLRIGMVLERWPDDAARMEGATRDAFSLLAEDTRRRDDFLGWQDLADQLAVLRYGKDNTDRANEKVEAAVDWRRARASASFVAQQAGLRPKNAEAFSNVPVSLFWPEDPALSMRVVRQLTERNDLERARNECRKLVDTFPTVQMFRFLLGRLLVSEGRLEAAAAEFREILDHVPTDTEVLDYARRTDLALGRHEAASDLVNKMILEDPLGQGATAYGNRLLERGHALQARKLIERLLRWTELSSRSDVLILSARADMALGDVQRAEDTLATLANLYPDSLEVASLALEIGLEHEKPSLVAAAVATLDLIAGTLFPDQMRSVPQALLEHGLAEEVLQIFGEDVRFLPAAVPALRPVAQASKAMGDVDGADLLLSRLEGGSSLVQDHDALVDRFVLLALDGRVPEAAHRLRLTTVRPAQRGRVECCLLAGSALQGLHALNDATPGERLRELGFDDHVAERELQLFDALLRLTSNLRRLSDVLPATVVEAPETTHPLVARDIEAIVELARREPELAGELCEALILLVLMQDRPFWDSERRYICSRVLQLSPGLSLPSRLLARIYLEDDAPREAIEVLKPLLIDLEPDLDVLALFMEATQAHEKEEWGIGLALLLIEEGTAGVQLLLADTLRERGHPTEAIPYYLAERERQPEGTGPLAGLIGSYAALRKNDPMRQTIREALEAHPDDEALASICADALSGLFRAEGEALELLESITDRFPRLFAASEALARGLAGDPEAVASVLDPMAERMLSEPVPVGSEAAQRRSAVLVRAARTARMDDLPDLARRLNEMALRLEPGSITQYRELANLELEEGHLDIARRYYEVLSFADLSDKETSIILAKLLFSRLGRPIEAAEVIERTFTHSLPPDAVEIMAARAYLEGDPAAAISEFAAVVGSPLITDETLMSVALIAYASSQDDVARALLDLVMEHVGAESPLYPRARFLRQERL